MSLAQSFDRTSPGAGGARIPSRGARRGAYSLIEMIIALLVMQIVASFVAYSVSSLSDGTKLDQASKRVMGAMRYARALAMSSGQNCHVDFNLMNQTVNVYLGASTTPVSNPLFPGGQMALNLITDQGVSGTRISAWTNCAVYGGGIYRCSYGKMGTRINAPSYAQPMTVTFTYNSTSTTLTIPNAGDPY